MSRTHTSTSTSHKAGLRRPLPIADRTASSSSTISSKSTNTCTSSSSSSSSSHSSTSSSVDLPSSASFGTALGSTTPNEDQIMAMLGLELLYTPSLCDKVTSIQNQRSSDQSSTTTSTSSSSGTYKYHTPDGSLCSINSSSSTSTSASSSQPVILASIANHDTWRSKICEWSYRVIDHFRYDREIVSVAMNYFDRYLVLAEREVQEERERGEARRLEEEHKQKECGNEQKRQQQRQRQRQQRDTSTSSVGVQNDNNGVDRSSSVGSMGPSDQSRYGSFVPPPPRPTSTTRRQRQQRQPKPWSSSSSSSSSSRYIDCRNSLLHRSASTASASSRQSSIGSLGIGREGGESAGPQDAQGRPGPIDSRTYQLAAMTSLYLAVKLHADQVEAGPSDASGSEQQQQQKHPSTSTTNSSRASSNHQQNGRHSRQGCRPSSPIATTSSSNNTSSIRQSSSSLFHTGGRCRTSQSSLAEQAAPDTPTTPTKPVAPIRRLRLSSFVELSRGQFSGRDITSMEQTLLSTLSWRVNPPTPMIFVSHLLRVMPTFALGRNSVAPSRRAQPRQLPQGLVSPSSIASSSSEASYDGTQDQDGGASLSTPSTFSNSIGSSHTSSSAYSLASFHLAQDPAKHRSLVLHVLHELSRYLTELSICLPDVSTVHTPGTVAFAAILISLDLLSSRTAVPTSVRRAYLERLHQLSAGRLNATSEAVLSLKAKMAEAFVPDMLDDSLAVAASAAASADPHQVPGAAGANSGHPILIARDAGLLSTSLEQRFGYWGRQPSTVEPPMTVSPHQHEEVSEQQHRRIISETAFAPPSPTRSYRPSTSPPATTDQMAGDFHRHRDLSQSYSADDSSNTHASSVLEASLSADESFDLMEDDTAHADAYRHTHKPQHQQQPQQVRNGSYTVFDPTTGRERSVNCVVEEAAIQIRKRLSKEHLQERCGSPTKKHNRNKSRQICDFKALESASDTSRSTHDSSSGSGSSGGNSSNSRPGHVRQSSWMSDSSESPTTVAGIMEALAKQQGTSSGMTKPPMHNQQPTGYLL